MLIETSIVSDANSWMYVTGIVGNRKVDLPVLKVQPVRLFDLLLCAHQHPYDREGFKEAVLKLFPGREEKSVFRGMAIPTLRRLGLIIGYDDLIRLSSDGFLLVKAWELSSEQGQRALRAYLLEYEFKRGWRIIDNFFKETDKHAFIAGFLGNIEAPNTIQASERLQDWLSYLCFSSLVSCNDHLLINQENFQRASRDIDFMDKKPFFQKFFLAAYKEVSQLYKGISTVEIDEVRRAVAEMALKQRNSILTSRQFDELLRFDVEMITNRYMISFGRSMGADAESCPAEIEASSATLKQQIEKLARFPQ